MSKAALYNLFHDLHSYTEKMYKQYEELCYYTLKVFFPDMAKKQITGGRKQIYSEICKACKEMACTNSKLYKRVKE